MYIYGSGITEFEFRVSNKYEINTTYATNWFQCADGNYYASDRGYQADDYSAKINTYGLESYINNILEQFDNNRGTYVFNMSGFVEDEHIFGEDIDYSIPLSGVILDSGERKNNSWKGFSEEFLIRCLSPSFSGTPSLPTWSESCISIGYNNQQLYSKNVYDSYYGNFKYYDHQNDYGTITFTLNLTNTEVRNLRTWMRTNRDTSFTLTDLNGIDTIIPNMSYPIDMKIISIKEREKFGIDRWIIDVNLVTHI